MLKLWNQLEQLQERNKQNLSAYLCSWVPSHRKAFGRQDLSIELWLTLACRLSVAEAVEQCQTEQAYRS